VPKVNTNCKGTGTVKVKQHKSCRERNRK